MCGGSVGKVIGSVTDAIGLTDTKAASKGYDAQAAEAQAKRDAQTAANEETQARKKRKASTVLSSVDDDKKGTLGG
ncbi:hypothetical protein D7V64_02775 [Acinetobacter cumulans]|jgi:hypothetical protein|uniref:Uncharacterized protein n=1 Tax=Acinetobacter cumulans TaxID=2136182 RepID=A0A3A8GQF0_9GAMM|nr:MULTISPECIES: hypothetical protein [Acinetobacter]NWK73145.1 hypothetical protein [Acinetobacter sp. SwsAc6]RKG44872.1 hypothetical protein D7V31_01375 [Acinetobacter sp. WCHAc060007]RKG45150.1 hypothetical protein D7V51_05815 [Acinetobacter cumulans]RKG50842.1 hypothetical protein D7V68_02765 [Acinetobacter cumulans]RKG55253.1 hypothetical protein D7V64_02775 [Acinetobacter cumulans]